MGESIGLNSTNSLHKQLIGKGVQPRTGAGHWGLEDYSKIASMVEGDLALGATANMSLTSTLSNDSNSSLSHLHESSGPLVTVRYVVLVLYLITFVFGLVGNTLTIFVILKNKRMKTVATCFILNLAIADDLFILSLPFMAHSTFTQNWVFGSGLCKIMSALYGINLYASIFTMVLMSMDRYLAIVYPLRSIKYRTIRNAIYVCSVTWIVCFVIMMPYWLYAHTKESQPEVNICKIHWPISSQLAHMWWWTNFQLIIGFILPIIIMSICYIQLLKHLRNTSPSGRLQDQTKKPIKKVTIMVFVVTIVFIVCWTPYHIVRYTNAFKMKEYMLYKQPPSHHEFVNFVIFNTVAQALVFLSSCCNPFIYAISSRNFRKLYMAAIFKCCRPRGALTLRTPPPPPAAAAASAACRYLGHASREVAVRWRLLSHVQLWKVTASWLSAAAAVVVVVPLLCHTRTAHWYTTWRGWSDPECS